MHSDTTDTDSVGSSDDNSSSGLLRSEDGKWTLQLTDGEVIQGHPTYPETLPRYLNCLDPLFEEARDRSEFNFLWSIFAIRGLQDAGWDPYETTQRAIQTIRTAANEVTGEASQHLALWLYGHIVEASEPYEFLANLIDVAGGGRFLAYRFPPKRNGAPVSPETKIKKLEIAASAAGFSEAVKPMREIWDRDLRNAVFHADYALYGPEVRITRPTRVYTYDEVIALVNRALACHEALTILRKLHVASYKEPTLIPADPEFTNNPGEMATVIVRQGHGATGLKHSWSREEIARGCIPYRAGHFSRAEMRLMEADPTLALLPARIT